MSEFPLPPRRHPDGKIHRELLADGIARLSQGKSNNTGSVTLTENVASTTLTDSRIGVDTILVLMPTTANAAAALSTTYVSTSGRVNGSIVITHANNAQTDRTFYYALIG